MKTKIRNFTGLKPLMAALKKELKSGSWVLFDQTVFTHFAKDCTSLQDRIILFPGGEDCKRWSELGKLLAILSGQSIGRDKTLYVVGGGAICDLGAFAAALHRRGMRLVLVPTTLLAQADAALGGKTAVDLTIEGRLLKNAAGVFYPAAELWLSTVWLSTLTSRERRSGIAEVLKMHWLNGKLPPLKGWADWSKGGGGALPKSLEQAVANSLRWKAAVVTRDPYDQKGIRASLNFGHSLGHAIESLGAGRISHGAAVAWGMWAECEFAGSPLAAEIFFVLHDLGYELPRFLAKAPVSDWERLLAGDKKMLNGSLQMPVLMKAGRVTMKKVDSKKLAAFAARLFSTSAVL